MKNHLKRHNSPTTWSIKRKNITFITRPSPGGNSMEYSMPIVVILRELLNKAETRKEVKYMLKEKNVTVNGKRVHKDNLPVGLFDIIGFPEINEYYTMMIDKSGRLKSVVITKEEAASKLCSLRGKTMIKKGTMQLNTFDGKTILVKKDVYKVGDTIRLNLTDNKITDHLKFEKGATVTLYHGKHIGSLGTVEEIKGNNIIFKTKDGEVFETKKEYIFVIDKEVLKRISTK